MAAAPILEVESLNVAIPVPAGTLHPVQEVGFRVTRGHTLAIVGESGCGKSLTSLALMNLLPPRAARTAGRLALDGQDLLGLSERRWRTSGEPDEHDLPGAHDLVEPRLHVGDQLIEAERRHRRTSVTAARDRAVWLLEKVGMTGAGERLRQYPHQLSGGLRQRVMIAMALMCDPDLIIADEPTTALDVTIQAQILHLLADLQREFETGLILITHDLGVVARLCDRVAVMYAGQIVEEEGTARQIFRTPAHPYTRGLLDCIPIPGKTRRGAHLGTIPGIVPSLVGSMPGCHFADRCPHASGACRSGPIAFRDGAGPGHRYRCVLSLPSGPARPDPAP